MRSARRNLPSGIHRVDDHRKIEVTHPPHRPVRKMRAIHLFFIQDFEARMTVVLFNHLDQWPNKICFTLKQLAKIPAVIGKCTGNAQARVLLRCMGNNIINILWAEMRTRRAEVEESDHRRSFLIGTLPASQSTEGTGQFKWNLTDAT